jgi:hypothetical protein
LDLKGVIRFRNPQESKKDSFGEERRVRERKSDSFIIKNPFVRHIKNVSHCLPLKPHLDF